MSMFSKTGNFFLQPAAMTMAAAVLLAAALAMSAQAAERVALVIGNGSYERSPSLRNPANDARAMAEKLRSVGFKLVGDKAHVDVKHRRMARLLRDLQNLLSKSGPAATALVYYSGHGVAQDGSNWLVPVDDGDIRYREDVPDFAIGARRVLRRLERRAGGLNILILDACRNNPLPSRHGTKGDWTKGLARIEHAPPSTMIVYAAAPGKVAYDGDGRLSPFTGALIEHMGKPGDSLDQVLGATAEAVQKQTAGMAHGPQQVWLEKQPHKDAFYFVPKPKKTGSAATIKPDGGKGDPPPPPPGDAAARMYEAAERANTIHAYRLFGRKFAGTYYAGLAQENIRKLKGAGTQTMPAPATPEPDPAEAAEAALALTVADRRLIQSGLASLGFDPGPADGVFRLSTRAALKAWQAKTGAAATGRLTPASASTLKAAGDKAARARFERTLTVGKTFREWNCADCPEMVVVPAGSFTMGSPENEVGRSKNEGPQHGVTIQQPFAVGKYEVTRGEFARFVAATGHATGNSCWGYDGSDWKDRSGRGWRNPGFTQTKRDPAVCVSWEDVKAYVRWLSAKTGRRYRLLSEAEWEYAARAGTAGPFHFGATISTDRANYDGNYVYGSGAKGIYRRKTVPVGGFSANAFGLHDMHGNVWEWVEDCWHGNYQGAPTDGRTWTQGGYCQYRVTRGGSWFRNSNDLSAADRAMRAAGDNSSTS